MLSWRAWMGDTHNRDTESSGKGEAIAERNKDEIRLKEMVGLREVSWKYQERTDDHRCWDSGAGSVLEEQVVFPSSQALESENHGCPWDSNLSLTGWPWTWFLITVYSLSSLVEIVPTSFRWNNRMIMYRITMHMLSRVHGYYMLPVTITVFILCLPWFFSNAILFLYLHRKFHFTFQDPAQMLQSLQTHPWIFLLLYVGLIIQVSTYWVTSVCKM